MILKLGLAALLFAFVSGSILDIIKDTLSGDELQAFANFRTSFKRAYKDNSSEFGKRRGLFVKAYREMKSLAADSKKKGYELGVTKFMDMTDEEREAAIIPKTFDKDIGGIIGPAPDAPQTDRSKRDTVYADWRLSNCMPAIRDQGQCGSCWSFATINSIEVQYCAFHSNNLYQFSEQHLMDCETQSNGCNGGYTNTALNFSMVRGNCYRSAYPYTHVKGSCRNIQAYLTTQTWWWVTGSTYPQITTNAEYYVRYFGPLTFIIYIPQDFYYYKSGVYVPDQTKCKPTSAAAGIHAMTIVGYGVDNNGRAYWIIRNSWGTSWGMNGYMFIQKGANACYMEDKLYMPVVYGNTNYNG